MIQAFNPLNLPGIFSDVVSTWADLHWTGDLVLRITLALALAWLAQWGLSRCHARWRVLLWRGTALSIIMIPLLGMLVPRVGISVPSSRELRTETSLSPSEDLVHLERELPCGGFLLKTDRPETDSLDPQEVVPSATAPSITSLDGAAWQWPSLSNVLLTIWLVGVVVLSGRWAVGQGSVRQLLLRCSAPPENCASSLEEVHRQLGEGRGIALRISDELDVPFAAGLLKGVVVVPTRLCDDDQTAELKGVLAHELSHHLSHDLAWMGVWQWLGILLWFHPLVWRINRVHGMACEEVADASAARLTGGFASYAGILARTALRCRKPLPVGIAISMAAGPEIMTRLQRLEHGSTSSPPARRAIVAALIMGICVMAGVAGIEFVRGEGNSSADSAKTLTFPEDRLIGTISIATGVKEEWAERQTQATCMPHLDWQDLGVARGKVAIPEGALVKLTLSATGANDPSWVTLLDGDDIYELLIEGYGEGFHCGDEQMEQLCDLSELQVLRVRQIDLTDRGAKSLERLQQLRILETNRSNITNTGLKSIGKLTTLECLTLSAEPNPKLDDSGLAALATLTSLQELHLHSRGLTGAGMKYLTKLPELIWFRPGGSPTPDLYLSSFRGAKSLKVIDLSHLEVTDEGLKHLASFPQVEEVNLYKCPKLSDAGMTHLKALKTLQRIDVGVEMGPRSATAITKRGVGELAQLPHLTKLFLNNIDADDECCRRLSQHKEMTLDRGERING